MIIGTAGHIDHGKSTLIAALTGRAMDRLAEERRRGITIELNFAPLELEGVAPIGIVDVPGHEDLVRTMVAGASGIDLLLLVVDAQEGLRPQTHEHLAIAEQLGIPAGIAVLAKADLVDPDWLALVRVELAERLARSSVRFGEALVVSAVTGQGLDRLREEIRRRAAAPSHRAEAGEPFRMPIDRVFSVAGAGTVVTGTVWSGRGHAGQAVRIQPGGREARVRTVESFGTSAPEALPGMRAALNLTGVDRADLRRGQVVVGAVTTWPPTEVIDAVVTLLPEATKPLATRTRVRLHHGTAEVMARVYPRQPIHPGSSAMARLLVEEPLLVRGGDRFVLRSYSPAATIGGGWIADPLPPRKADWPEDLAAPDPATRLAALVQRRDSGVSGESLPILLGLSSSECDAVARTAPGITPIGGQWLASAAVRKARDMIRQRVEAFHAAEPSAAGISLETLRRSLGASAWLADPVLELLVKEGQLVSSAGVVAKVGFVPSSAGGEGEVAAVVRALNAAGLEAPALPELATALSVRDLRGALRIAASRGQVEQVGPDWYVARGALEGLVGVLKEVGAGRREITLAEVRDRVGLSRKYLIPLLEWADRTGITRRDQEGRRTLV